jgi:hypothetical protein
VVVEPVHNTAAQVANNNESLFDEYEA